MRARGIGYVLVNVGELGRLIDKDRYYDADVSGERVKRWIESLSRPAVSPMGALPPGATARGILLKAWPEEGRALYRLLRDFERGEGATGGGGGGTVPGCTVANGGGARGAPLAGADGSASGAGDWA